MVRGEGWRGEGFLSVHGAIVSQDQPILQVLISPPPPPPPTTVVCALLKTVEGRGGGGGGQAADFLKD